MRKAVRSAAHLAAASKKLGELRKTTASCWDAKPSFVGAYKDLRDSLDKTAGELKKS